MVLQFSNGLEQMNINNSTCQTNSEFTSLNTPLRAPFKLQRGLVIDPSHRRGGNDPRLPRGFTGRDSIIDLTKEFVLLQNLFEALRCSWCLPQIQVFETKKARILKNVKKLIKEGKSFNFFCYLKI